MTRRVWLAAAVAPLLRADAADDAWDLVADAVRALSAATGLPPPRGGSAELFLSYFDKKMPGYEQLRADATALVGRYEIQCSVDPIENNGDDRSRELDLDWQLRLTDPATNIVSTRREKDVKCRVEKQGKKWKIVSFAPERFFAPPNVG